MVLENTLRDKFRNKIGSRISNYNYLRIIYFFLEKSKKINWNTNVYNNCLILLQIIRQSSYRGQYKIDT